MFAPRPAERPFLRTVDCPRIGLCRPPWVADWSDSGLIDVETVPNAFCTYRHWALIVGLGCAALSACSGGLDEDVSPSTAAGPPRIATHPSSVTVAQGARADFVVAASGVGPLTYQWRRNGTNVVGATAERYSIAVTTAADQGASFDVTVANPHGSVTSQPAVLSFAGGSIAPAFAANSPAARWVAVGAEATFIALGTQGSPPPSLQWQRSTDGGASWSNLAGATDLTYTVAAVTVADDGNQYRVVASNGAGSVTSRAARLIVSRPTDTWSVLAGQVDFDPRASLDGAGTSARLALPTSMVKDVAGNLYIVQGGTTRVSKIAPDGAVTTLFDPPQSVDLSTVARTPDGSLFAFADSCQLYHIQGPLMPGAVTVTPQTATGCTKRALYVRGAAFDVNGSLHVLMSLPAAILRLDALTGRNYSTTLIAGDPTAPDGNAGSADGVGTAARFNFPQSLAFGPSGDLFVADSLNHTIRRVVTSGAQMGSVTTYAGLAGSAESVDGALAVARFDLPIALEFDAAGNLYVLETGRGNSAAKLRRIATNGMVSTVVDLRAELDDVLKLDSLSDLPAFRGMALLSGGRIALLAGDAVLIRRLP